MSKLRVLIMMILAIALATGVIAYAEANSLQISSDPAIYGLPRTIGGYRVLAVNTANHVPCIPNDRPRIVLQALEPSAKMFLSNARSQAIRRDLNARSITSTVNWQIEIVGPSITQAQTRSEAKELKAVVREHGCLKSSPAYEGNNGDELQSFTPGRSFTLFENMDADDYTNDTAQSVLLIAPEVGNNQDPDGSRFLNNVKTDAAEFFMLQNGFELRAGNGYLMWTTSTFDLINQYYNTNDIDYIEGNIYYLSITFTGGTWYMCAEDLDTPGTYVCQAEEFVVGESLERNVNTSVWMENWNSSSSWVDDFSDPWQAYDAMIYLDGVGQFWSDEHKHTLHSCSTSHLPSNAMSGTLINGGFASFYISNAPLYCP